MSTLPRKARIQSPTDYYHVMVRGNNRERIFENNNQKIRFLDSLKEQCDEGILDIAAYCIMDNHIHLVVKAELANLTQAIRKINIKYAVGFNNQNHRIGHVFQDRYKSEIIGNDRYLLNVVRYVHNNPVNANIVNCSSEYKWSSYNEYIKENKVITNSQKVFILGCYNNVEDFVEFHKQKDTQEYLETNEDLEVIRLSRAQELISTYFKMHGINEVNELKRYPMHMDGIIKNMLNESKLSHRKIAKLLNINSSTVHFANLENH